MGNVKVANRSCHSSGYYCLLVFVSVVLFCVFFSLTLSSLGTSLTNISF